MKRGPFESAIDEILASSVGDVQRALHAMLGGNIELESELRSLYAASEHGKFTDTKNSLHQLAMTAARHARKISRCRASNQDSSGEHAVVLKQCGLDEEKTCFHGTRRRC
jgi:hypothetical protein